jgi:hypothetical protein
MSKPLERYITVALTSRCYWARGEALRAGRIQEGVYGGRGEWVGGQPRAGARRQVALRPRVQLAWGVELVYVSVRRTWTDQGGVGAFRRGRCRGVRWTQVDVAPTATVPPKRRVRACVRACVRAWVRACGVRACGVRACVRAACVRAACVRAACVRMWCRRCGGRWCATHTDALSSRLSSQRFK